LPIDLDQYRWLFTPGTGEVDVGLETFRVAIDSLRIACNSHTVHIKGL
jgi:hypothetical protein